MVTLRELLLVQEKKWTKTGKNRKIQKIGIDK